MLLSIQNFSRDMLSDVLLKIVPQNKRNGLTFFNANLSYQALSVNTLALFFSKGYGGAACFVLSLVNRDIELELDFFATKSGDFACSVNYGVVCLVKSRLMLISAIVE
jgi:hypothetical protein